MLDAWLAAPLPGHRLFVALASSAAWSQTNQTFEAAVHFWQGSLPGQFDPAFYSVHSLSLWLARTSAECFGVAALEVGSGRAAAASETPSWIAPPSTYSCWRYSSSWRVGWRSPPHLGPVAAGAGRSHSWRSGLAAG